MPDPAFHAELLRSLGRLVRGLSALFWGLPLALIVCVGTAGAGWFRNFGILPPLAVTALLCFGIWQLGSFQKQERPWRNALDRAKCLALINCGLSPFLYWWNGIPDSLFFNVMVGALAVSATLFLLMLNLVLLRLGAMLPDETLRLETRQYTALNRLLLVAFLSLAVVYLAVSRWIPAWYSGGANPPEAVGAGPARLEFQIPYGLEASAVWLVWLTVCLLVLLPLAMTMALTWKTKEVILDSVFGGNST